MAGVMRGVLPPLTINLAPTGMVPTRNLSATVPLQPGEIVRDVLACADLGITIVHLHARDKDGLPTHSKDIYARIIAGIRDYRPDLILCVSCSGRGGVPLEQRAEVLDLAEDLQPDMASLTLSSLNFVDGASVNSPDTVADLAARMKAQGITPEFEVFDIGMANMLHALARRGFVSPPFYANLLFGNIASAQARFLDMGAVVASLPAETTYALAGIGAAQLPVAAMAAAAAPGVRIGLEDNLWLDQSRLYPASNASLVERVHRLAELVGRPIMTATDLRLRFAMPGREGTRRST